MTRLMYKYIETDVQQVKTDHIYSQLWTYIAFYNVDEYLKISIEIMVFFNDI